MLGEGEPDVERLSGDVPDTVRELIMQMLEQLDPVDGELLSAASVVGQEFSAAAAAAAAAGLAEAEVDARCDALSRAGRFIEPSGEERWPDETLSTRYRFAHDLHREVLYARLTAGQRAQMHGRIGKRLEAAYRTRPREIAAKLAEHFVQAGDAGRAVVSLRLAAEQAFERLAHPEALEPPDHSPRHARAPRGGPRSAGPRSSRCSRCSGQRRSPRVAGRRRRSRRHSCERATWRSCSAAATSWARRCSGSARCTRSVASTSARKHCCEQTLALSGPTASSGLVTDSHELLACSLFHQGVFASALEHAEQGVAAYDEQYLNPVRAAYGINAGAQCHSWAALSLWFLGYPDLARERAGEAVALAEDPRRRHGYATALAQAATVEQCRLDAVATRTNAQAAIEAATQDGYPYRIAMGSILHGWALAAEGAHDEGIAELEHGLELSRETGAHMDDPYYFALLADACTRAGRRSTRPGRPSRPAWGSRHPIAGSSSRASSTAWPESSSCASADATRQRRDCGRRSNSRAARARPPSSCERH